MNIGPCILRREMSGSASQAIDAAKFAIFDAEAQLVKAEGVTKPGLIVVLKKLALQDLRQASAKLEAAQRELEDQLFEGP